MIDLDMIDFTSSLTALAFLSVLVTLTKTRPDLWNWLQKLIEKWLWEYLVIAEKLATLFRTKERMIACYKECVRSSRAIRFTGLLCPDVLVPLSYRKFIDVRSQKELSVDDGHFNLLASDYSFLSPTIRQPKVHQDAIRLAILPRKALASWIPIVAEQIEQVFESQFPPKNDEMGTAEYKMQNLHDVLYNVICTAASRVVSGVELYQNRSYMSNSLAFTRLVAGISAVMNICPKWSHPLFGRICSIPSQIFYLRCARHSLPIIQRKLQQEKNSPSDPLDQDILQTLIAQALRSDDPIEGTPRQISLRLLLLTFASTFPTFAVTWNIVLDLIASNRESGIIDAIREEIRGIKGENTPLESWTLEDLDNLRCLDSVMKESMRIWSPLQFAAPRTVVSEDGIVLPDGTHVSHGSTIGLPMYAIHHDPTFYPDPTTFDPFRFLKLRQNCNDQQQKSYTLTSTSNPNYIAFGLPLNSCPGRHLAAVLMKLVLVYLICRFDLKDMEKRPQPFVIGGIIVPPGPTNVGVRRRTAV